MFSKHFVAVHKKKPVLTFNKPIYVGFSILDLRKLLMYEFHNKYFKNKLDATLLFTDTLLFNDFSDYALDSKFFDPANKKVIGKMKDEFKGKIISEFVGLKSKMYSLINIDNKEFKVDCIELELIMFVRLHCLVLMIKDMY